MNSLESLNFIEFKKLINAIKRKVKHYQHCSIRVEKGAEFRPGQRIASKTVLFIKPSPRYGDPRVVKAFVRARLRDH